VPTPVDEHNQPDLRPVISATESVAAMLDGARKPIVVYESTVYPGVTEEICGPLLERISGLKRGEDFFLGYSPERINPGDREHTVDRIVKVIAGETEAVPDKITQIFSRMNISIWDVLEAAGTKWNFLRFQPGLVGGHCIGVDPYYLSYRAQQLGQEPHVILAGRSINDGMGAWVADQLHAQRQKPGSALVMGLSFKENVPDLRNSKVIDVIRRLEALGHQVTVHDPLADPAEAMHEYDVALDTGALGGPYDLVVVAVPHAAYADLTDAQIAALVAPGGLIADLKNLYGGRTFPDQVERWSL
jgi:UDP-N-acetyl-D-galactosamine dehydrogenase